MKKKIFGAALISAMAVAAGWNFNQSKNETQLSDLALANVEALANGESGGCFGCGNAAYEWDSDWYEDTKNFTKCRSGCPEGSGTEPKYMNC